MAQLEKPPATPGPRNCLWSRALESLPSKHAIEHLLLHGYSTLLFVGNAKSGKTTIIGKFDKSEEGAKETNNEGEVLQETISLKYRFLKRNYSNQSRDFNPDLASIGKVCNVWELGNGLLFTDLVEFALTVDTIRTASVVIVIDLTRPEEMITMLETIIQRILTHIRDNLLNDNHDLSQRLSIQAKERLGYYRRFKEDGDSAASEHVDAQVTSFPIPLTIIGSKYDEFQNLDPEKRKIIARYLRSVSHQHGGQLVFTSEKSETLTKRVNAILEQLAFEPVLYETFDKSQTNLASKPSVSSNYNKPIVIPFGYDTLDKIGVTSLEEAKQSFQNIFPTLDLPALMSSPATVNVDPLHDPNFAEPKLDKVLEYKYMLIDQNK